LKEIPHRLLESVPAADRAGVVRWWNKVPESDQLEVARLYDPLVEDSFFEPSQDGECPPAVQGGLFVPQDDAWRFEEWETDWREYLVEHPAVSLGDRWVENSVLLATQFRGGSWLLGDGILTISTDWGWTELKAGELPPSAQRQSRAGHCT